VGIFGRTGTQGSSELGRKNQEQVETPSTNMEALPATTDLFSKGAAIRSYKISDPIKSGSNQQGSCPQSL